MWCCVRPFLTHALQEDLAGQAAADACEAIKSAIAGSGRAVVLFSAGTGQDEFYEALMAKEDVDWTKVIGVPDAELVGKSAADDTSAGAYLQQKVVAMVAEKPFKVPLRYRTAPYGMALTRHT